MVWFLTQVLTFLDERSRWSSSLVQNWEMEMEIESRDEDLKSMLPFLPLALRSSTLFWPSQVVETLKSMAAGPDQSGVNSGEALFYSISNIRHSLSLSNQRLASSAQHGYVLFFDKVLRFSCFLFLFTIPLFTCKYWYHFVKWSNIKRELSICYFNLDNNTRCRTIWSVLPLKKILVLVH